MGPRGARPGRRLRHAEARQAGRDQVSCDWSVVLACWQYRPLIGQRRGLSAEDRRRPEEVRGPALPGLVQGHLPRQPHLHLEHGEGRLRWGLGGALDHKVHWRYIS